MMDIDDTQVKRLRYASQIQREGDCENLTVVQTRTAAGPAFRCITRCPSLVGLRRVPHQPSNEPARNHPNGVLRRLDSPPTRIRALDGNRRTNLSTACGPRKRANLWDSLVLGIQPGHHGHGGAHGE